MAEVTRITFDFKEIVTELLKKEGIHEGIWMFYVEFALAATNAPVLSEGDAEPTPTDNPLEYILPTAILPVKKVGIQRTDQVSNLSVDAAVVNPKPKQEKAKKEEK
jgi:hypothetical protein